MRSFFLKIKISSEQYPVIGVKEYGSEIASQVEVAHVHCIMVLLTKILFTIASFSGCNEEHITYSCFSQCDCEYRQGIQQPRFGSSFKLQWRLCSICLLNV